MRNHSLVLYRPKVDLGVVMIPYIIISRVCCAPVCRRLLLLLLLIIWWLEREAESIPPCSDLHALALQMCVECSCYVCVCVAHVYLGKQMWGNKSPECVAVCHAQLLVTSSAQHAP